MSTRFFISVLLKYCHIPVNLHEIIEHIREGGRRGGGKHKQVVYKLNIFFFFLITPCIGWGGLRGEGLGGGGWREYVQAGFAGGRGVS